LLTGLDGPGRLLVSTDGLVSETPEEVGTVLLSNTRALKEEEESRSEDTAFMVGVHTEEI
jgi:hypothetical protein